MNEQAGPSGSGTAAATSENGGLSYADAFPSLPDTGRPTIPTSSPWAAKTVQTARPAVQSQTAHEVSFEE